MPAFAVGCRSLHVLYEKLPYDIAERHVLLMDPILASGNTCAAAIEVGSSTVKTQGIWWAKQVSVVVLWSKF